MKRLAFPAVVLVLALVVFPVVFATGDTPGIGCTAGGDVARILATIRALESGGDYTARATGSSASGAYQFLDGTWNYYAGYPHAWQAPPNIQDAKAADLVNHILGTHDGDITTVPVIWYIGHLPAPASPEWDQVPAPTAGNRLTPRQYRQRWLTEYDRQPANDDAEAPELSCPSGDAIVPFDDGYAIPGPADLFAAAPVDAPHHDYPAWDWMLPTGTPIYAIHGGQVVSVQYWPYNWWDHGCGPDPAGCHTCGIGVTIQDDNGTRWTYCHANTATVAVGATVDAGTQILTSGNTGRSSGPHLHLQIRTADGVLRCPQQLLRSLRDTGTRPPVGQLPVTGCSH